MRILPGAALLVVSMAGGQASPQSASDETLKAICLAETKAYFARDMTAWQQGWLHDPSVTRTLIGIGNTLTVQGWSNVSAMAAKEVESNPEPIPIEIVFEHFISRSSGSLAWVEYDETTSSPDGSQLGSKSHERRLLANDGGSWKIAAQVTIASTSTEEEINGLGYRLLSESKAQDAIELFKMNVRLFPDSWNVYDSLGEAYAAAGQKDLAIQNYEKSLQLNAKNENGKAALAKLKGK